MTQSMLDAKVGKSSKRKSKDADEKQQPFSAKCIQPTFSFSFPTIEPIAAEKSEESAAAPVNGQIAFMEQNLPVYKTGYDKYLSFVTSPDQKIRVMLSERQGPVNAPLLTGKAITLKL